jgi:gas vesicle protein
MATIVHVPALVLSDSSLAGIKGYVAKSLETDRARKRVIDSLIADGVTPAHLVAPKKGQDRQFFDGVLKPAVVMGFSSTVQTLLETDTNKLNEVQKSDKRYWSQQINSKIKDIRRAMLKRQEKGANERKTFAERLETQIQEMIDDIQKKEDSGVCDPVALIAALQEAIYAI